MGAIPFITGQELDTAYTDDDLFALGAKCKDDMGREYIFLKYKKLGESEGVEGLCGCGLDSAYNNYEASSDVNHADAVAGNPTGQFQAQLDGDQMGWSQYLGYNRKAASTGLVTKGDEVYLAGDQRGILVTKSVHQTSVGTALENSTAGVLAAGELYLQIPV